MACQDRRRVAVSGKGGISLGRTKRLNKKRDGPPVYAFEAVPGVPPVRVLRLLGHERPQGLPPTGSSAAGDAHSHDYLVLAYFERGGGSARLGGREWPVQAGDAYVISPGEVVGVGEAGGFERVEGWAAFFPPEVLGLQAPSAFLSWRAHPLLFPFVRGAGNPGAQRLRVPPAERVSWSERFATLDAELLQRRDGYREAALSHLTLLLVELSRLAVDVVGGPQAQGRAPHRRGIRLHRGTLPRADLAQGRPKGRGSLAGAPHHSRWAQDRADGSGVDRRTPHGGGAQVAG